MYMKTFMMYLLILPKRYAHGMFAAGRAFVPTHTQKKVSRYKISVYSTEQSIQLQ